MHGTFREMYSKTIEDTYRWSASKFNFWNYQYYKLIENWVVIKIIMTVYRKVISAKTNESASAVWTHPTYKIQLCINFLLPFLRSMYDAYCTMHICIYAHDMYVQGIKGQNMLVIYFGRQVQEPTLALITNVVTRWRNLHWKQILPLRDDLP